MKIIKYISLVLVLVISMTQCKLPDNVNPKAPSEVPISTLFTNAELALVNHVNDVSVNFNISRLIAQYWQETTYFDESRYLFQDRQIPDGHATRFYRDVLMDFKRAKELLTADGYGGDVNERDNMVAIIEVLEVYAWQCVVDAWGDMPYSEALMGAENSIPVYDDAAGIYDNLLTTLSDAIGSMKTSSGSFGGADLIYGGDVASWKRFANSLKMRVGMRLADVNAAKAETAVTQAIASGVFTSQDQSGYLFYVGVAPNVNAIYNAYVIDNRKDYIPTNTLVDYMVGFNDPRLPYLFTQVDDGSGNLIYLGAVAGLDAAQSYNNFSNFTDRFFEPTFEAILIDYVEVEFLLAEAAARFGNGDPATHYATAVTESILYWGGSAADATAYLGETGVAYNAANWKESIGTQKWLALYNRGVEAWAEWRRLDFPILNVPEGMTYGDIPKRMPYPYNEKNRNKTNYDNAVSAMGGTDDHRQRIFWDVN